MADPLSSHLLQTLNAARIQDEATKELTQEGAGKEYDPEQESQLPSLSVTERESRMVDSEAQENDIVTDYKKVRNVTYACQDLLLNMVDNAARVAVSTENPRAFDIVNNLVTNIRGLNKDLLEFGKMTLETKERAEPPGEGETKVTVTEGGVTVQQGRKTSTSEMLDKIEEYRKAQGSLEKFDNNSILEAECEEVIDGEGTEED